MAGTEVYLEVGKRRVFASALEWPGWCRSGRDEDGALAALAASAPRYAAVARAAGLDLPAGAAERLEVVERVAGSATTEFGAPAVPSERDGARLTPAQAERLARLVEGAWQVFDRVVAAAPAELRKGPRGCGRDRDGVVDHVLGAEVAYARKLGLKHKQPAQDDTRAIAAVRSDVLAALRSARGPALVEKGWPPRYAARRIAWHVVDHAWEIEDRAQE